MSSTQTINAILDAIETTLEADSTLTALLGNGASSILQDSADKILKTLIDNPAARTPLLLVNYEATNWKNDGKTYVRFLDVYVDVIVQDFKGLQDRQNKAYPIIDRIYTVLIESQLGLSNPEIDPLLPVKDSYLFEVYDNDNNPLEISAWRVQFKTAVFYQP